VQESGKGVDSGDVFMPAAVESATGLEAMTPAAPVTRRSFMEF
jgi:hypothetical protein